MTRMTTMQANAPSLFIVCVLAVGHSSPAPAQSIRIEGASAGSEVAKLASAEFQKARKGASYVVTGVSGSETALNRLCGNQIDIANTARPALKEELSACTKAGAELIELPIAFDSVVVVVNARNAFVQSLTLAQLRLMWGEKARGKIVRWNQVDPRFPAAPLKLLGPDPRYEQAGIFTETVLGPGQEPRRDTMTSVDDRILVQAVARDIYALAYVSYPTFDDHRGSIRSVPVVAAENAKASAGEVALSRPLFLYANARSLQKPGVREFVEFALANGERLAKSARYQPLTAASYRLGLAHLRNAKTGSAWDGAVPVGVTRQDVEKRMAAL
jgi:phosphate transport system substrate-binding protein